MGTSTVNVNLTRVDLVRTVLGVPWRLPRVTLMLWSPAFLYFFYVQMSSSGYNWTGREVFVAAFVGVVMATGFLLFWILLMLFSSQLRASYKAGILGTHRFAIVDEGLLESTIANETLSKWQSVTAAWRTRRYIFVRILPYGIHSIPIRAFLDKASADSFWAQLQSKLKTGV